MEVNTLWLFIPGCIILVWSLALHSAVRLAKKVLQTPEGFKERDTLRPAMWSMGAAANRTLLTAIVLISLGMAFS